MKELGRTGRGVGPQVSGRTKRAIENDSPKKTYKQINESRHPNDPRRAGPAGSAGGLSEVAEASNSTSSFRNAFN